MMRWIGHILVAAGALATIGMGAFFLALRPALLPEDIRFLGASADVLVASAPRLEQWLGHVFAVLGGFMTATGLLQLLLVWKADALGPAVVAAFVGAASSISLGTMTRVNFVIGSDYRWLITSFALCSLAGAGLLGLSVRRGER